MVEAQVLAILGANGEGLFLDIPNPIPGVCPKNTQVLVAQKSNFGVSHSVERMHPRCVSACASGD